MPFADGPYIFSFANIAGWPPTAPGVYGISGTVQMIYVGQSEDIQGRLLQHFNDKSHCIWEYGPYAFHFEKVLGGEDARRKREDELIAEYDPPCNEP